MDWQIIVDSSMRPLGHSMSIISKASRVLTFETFFMEYSTQAILMKKASFNFSLSCIIIDCVLVPVFSALDFAKNSHIQLQDYCLVSASLLMMSDGNRFST
ncbi:MAG: hypothetical protein ACJART_000636 [Maribacter sp.]